MSEWNAVDLHMHTVSGITRRKQHDNVVFSYLAFANAISSHKLKLIAPTNHNIIDFSNYLLIRYLSSKIESNALMGVELDTNLKNGKHVHIVCVFKSEDALLNYKTAKRLNESTNDKLRNEEVYYSAGEVVELVGQTDLIIIPHGSKSRGFLESSDKEQTDEVIKKVKEGFIRIFDQPSDWKLEKVKTHLETLDEEDLDLFGGSLFTDVRNWNMYDDVYKNFFMNAEPSFRGLLHSTTNPCKRFKLGSEILKNQNFISRIEIISSNQSLIKSCSLELSSGYNCIIGKSGSGKSLLLHLISKALGLYAPGNHEYDRFASACEVNLYNESGQLLNNQNINIARGVNLYIQIIRAISSRENSDYYSVVKLIDENFVGRAKFSRFKVDYENKLRTYVSYVDDYINKKNLFRETINDFKTKVDKAASLKNVKSFSLSLEKHDIVQTYSLTNEETIKSLIELIPDFSNQISFYKGKAKEDISLLLDGLSAYLNYALADVKENNALYALKCKKNDIINDAVRTINESISSQALEKSKIEQELPVIRQNIRSILKELFILKKTIDSFDLRIKEDDYNSTTVIGDTGIVVEETIDRSVFGQCNEKENDLFNTYGFKTFLDSTKTYNLFYFKDSKKLINAYIKVGLFNRSIYSFSTNLNPSVKIMIDGEDVKELNPGSISKKYIELYFSKQLNSNNSVLLFDQIENDVDKSFINVVIRKLLEDSKGRIQLIVVTHDPIVAVNADPNKYILASKDNYVIEYRDFVIESNTKDELETIANVVDGSKRVIKNRYEIYKGESNED